VYEEGAPHLNPGVWDLIHEKQIPLLGICYGMQELAHTHGGTVAKGLKREYGKSLVFRNEESMEAGEVLFKDIPDQDKGLQMWMSHGDKLETVPEGFVNIAHTSNAPHAAIANPEKQMFAVQFHPEVTHSPSGKKMLENFVVGVCKSPTDWNMTDIAEEFIQEVRDRVGPTGQVIGAVSGGVDSSVAATLLQKAIGDRFHAVLVDNGCLRLNESTEVMDRLHNKLGINLHLVDASERFMGVLEGIEDPEEKRKRIGRTFIEVFQEEAKRIEGEEVKFLLQGTLYPDVIESISYKGPSATIKSHHNVGGLPDIMNLELIEPLRELFKDEVRSLGLALGIEEASVWRHPFPGPGLAIRVLGPLNQGYLDTLRLADDILIQELHKHDLYKKIGQAFCVLLPCKSVGVMGDGRTYENVCAVRCVQTTDYMTADWFHMPYEVMGIISNRIINEVSGINRVTYDISSKPPATIEWE